jgi:TRAP-type C4-dicarboxylate transport system permease small subunit
MDKPSAPDRATEIAASLAALVFVVAVAVTALEVVLRYVFGAPTIWAHEATIFLCAVGYLLGGVYTMHRDDHIRITVVYERMPPRLRRAVDLLNAAIVLAFLAALAWAAAIAGWRAVVGWETTGSAWNPPIPALITPLIAVAAVLMMPYLLRNLRARRKR